MIDSSATLFWIYMDEATPAVERVLDQVVLERAWVPGLWRFEVANVLEIVPGTSLHVWGRTMNLAEQY